MANPALYNQVLREPTRRDPRAYILTANQSDFGTVYPCRIVRAAFYNGASVACLNHFKIKGWAHAQTIGNHADIGAASCQNRNGRWPSKTPIASNNVAILGDCKAILRCGSTA